MKPYKKPEFHFVRNTGGLSGEEIARLSDDELTEYLKKDSCAKEKKKYCIRPGFIVREIAGEYTIIPTDTESLISNAIMAPNDSAVFLWRAFEQPAPIEDVVIKGIQKYDVAEETMRNSTERFVRDSLRYKILEEVDENEKEMGRTEDSGSGVHTE